MTQREQFEKWIPKSWDITKIIDDEGDEVYSDDLTQGDGSG